MTDSFTPRHEVALAEGVAMEIYPPRVHSRQGMSTATRTGGAEEFTWTSELGEVRVTCRMCREGDRWEVAMTATNAGPDTEVALRYPTLYYRFPAGTPLREFDPVFGGVLEKRTIWVERHYPGDASLCAGFVAAPRLALGLAVRNDQQRRVRIYHVPGSVSGQISVEIERLRLRRGEALTLSTAYIAWGPTWGDVLRPYREWIAGHYRRLQPLSSWYWDGNWIETRLAHCLAPSAPAFPGVWTFDNVCAPQTFAQVRAEMDEAFDSLGKRGLRPLFYQFGWWQSMARCPGTFIFDSVNGDYTEGHHLIRPAIAYSHQRGGRTFLYTNFICIGEDATVTRAHPELLARDEAGQPIRNAQYPSYLLCPGAPAIRDFWERTLRTILVDLDADGLFLDQVGGGTPSAYCCDPSHHHDHPDVYGRDYLALLDWVCRRAREIKPDCFIGGELTSDIRSLWCDQMQGVGYSRPQELKFDTPARAAATPPGEHFAFMSFVNPEIAHLPSGPDYVARGCPGQPDNALWKQFRHVFRAGLQPCATDPVGAMAYLFGPVNGEAILATLALAELTDVSVTLPVALQPVAGELPCAQATAADVVRVDAGREPRFYRLQATP